MRATKQSGGSGPVLEGPLAEGPVLEGPLAEGPVLEGLVVHWQAEEHLDRLLEAWPSDPRFGLVIVDNSSSLEPIDRPGIQLIRSHGNLGFARGINVAFEHSTAPNLLLLNPDVCPLENALEILVEAFEQHPQCAGFAPRLIGPDGWSQHRWQLRPLPSALSLLLQALFLPGTSGPRSEPVDGSPVEQPAAAALALRRRAVEAVGGLDEDFFPAWFEDVDLAARLRQENLELRYCSRASFSHALGGSAARLGYRSFLWIYYRNLVRYLAKHHGAAWAGATRLLLPWSMLLRAIALPLRRPTRAATRIDALGGLGAVALGAASNWRRPCSLALAYRRPRW